MSKDWKYRSRIADQQLKSKLSSAGAVLVQGPKWCGKSTTALQIAGSSMMLGSPQARRSARELVTTAPDFLLNGLTPRLFDEWQVVPELWDAIRFEVDNRRQTGQFILTGSAVPADTEKIYHTGTGRFAWLKMRTMSLWESEESTGDVSLETLFGGQGKVFGHSRWQLQDIAYFLCRGGWPVTLQLTQKEALQTAVNYLDAIVESDISQVDNTLRNPRRTRLLLRSLARLQGSQAPMSTLRKDMAANDDDSLSEHTIASYLNALEKIFVVEDMPAWSVNLRSKTAIRTTANRYFTDPSIATAALGATSDKLMADIETLGLLFETMAMRDLRVYADAIDANVYHYRDKDGLECDAVIERRDGTYGLVEIKLGGEYGVEQGKQTLAKLAKKIDTDKAGLPAFRMVLTAVGDYALTAQNGTHIVPIGCLKP